MIRRRRSRRDRADFRKGEVTSFMIFGGYGQQRPNTLLKINLVKSNSHSSFLSVPLGRRQSGNFTQPL